MHSINFWHKFYILGRKGIAIVFLVLVSMEAFGQLSTEMNLPNYDKRRFHYGFLMGGHRSYMKIEYSQDFVDGNLDSIYSILPPQRLGFDLGFVVNYRLGELFDLRTTPKVGFYEYLIEYNFTDGSKINQLVEATIVELPILVKYKSIRWKNTRAYVIAGVNPALTASGNKDDFEERKLQVKDFNFSGELGFGFDFYFPLFKFSPEVRFSRGFLNLLDEDQFGYSDGLKSLKTSVFSFYLLFE